MKASFFIGALTLGLLCPATHCPAQDRAPGVAATTPNPAYPLRLRILGAQRVNDSYGVHGFGRADLIQEPIHGLDYTYECNYGFLHNASSDDYYEGRWKKPGSEIEILVQRIGSDRVDKCDLKVTMKPTAYSKHSVQLLQPAPAQSTPPTP